MQDQLKAKNKYISTNVPQNTASLFSLDGTGMRSEHRGLSNLRLVHIGRPSQSLNQRSNL